MTDWIVSTFSRTIDLLTRQGRADLASDLKRITTVIDIEDIDALLIPEAETLIETISDVESIHEFGSILHNLVEIFDISHCSITVVSENSGTYYPARFITTYPSEWIELYVKNGFFSIDPVISRCLSHKKGFYWNSVHTSSEREERFLEISREIGISSTGYTSVVPLEGNDQFGIHACAADSPDEFARRFERYRSDFEQIAYALATAFSGLSGGIGDPTSLTPDQLRLLRAVAMGSTPKELATIDFTFGSFDTVQKSVLETFGARTLAEAAVRATRSSILSASPLMRNEIFSFGSLIKPTRRSNIVSLNYEPDHKGDSPGMPGPCDPVPERLGYVNHPKG